MREKPITIQDIAQRVGVSKTTVSRYLNGQFEFMSNATRTAIAQAVLDLKYRPSSIARSLKSKQTKLVGVVIHSLENEVITLFLRGICDVLYERGYSPVIFNSYNGKELEIRNLQTCVDQRVDGIILSPSTSEFSFYSDICANGVPVVMANRYGHAWAYDAAYIDHYALVWRAMTHLRENGYTRVAFITNNRFAISTKAWREKAFLDFITQLPPGAGDGAVFRLAPSGDISKEAQRFVLDFLQNNPLERKALLCGDVLMLQTMIAATQTLGITVPEQLGLCGYDASAWGALVRPGITSLRQPFHELGRTAATMLMDRLSGNLPEGPKVELLQGTLEIRNSTQT